MAEERIKTEEIYFPQKMSRKGKGGGERKSEKRRERKEEIISKEGL